MLLQRDLFEDLGEVSVAFKGNPKIPAMVHTIMGAWARLPDVFPKITRTDTQPAWQNSMMQQMEAGVTSAFQVPIHELVDELADQLEVERIKQATVKHHGDAGLTSGKNN